MFDFILLVSYNDVWIRSANMRSRGFNYPKKFSKIFFCKEDLECTNSE